MEKKVIKKKENVYIKERTEILEKMYDILGITEKNKKFYSHELEEDKEKQEKILLLKKNKDMIIVF